MRNETDMTPQEQDEKRVEKIVTELTKTLGHTDTESAPYKLIKRAIVKAYQLGHTDGYADYFYDHQGDISDKIKDFGHFMCLDATDKVYYYLGGVVSFHDYAIPNAKYGEPDWDEDRYYADFDAMWENNLTDEQRINILKYVYDLKSDKEVEEFITTQMGGSPQRWKDRNNVN